MYAIHYGDVSADRWFPPWVRKGRGTITVLFNGEDVTNTTYESLSVLGLGFVKSFKTDEKDLFYVEPGTDHVARHPTRWGRVVVKPKDKLRERAREMYERIIAGLRRRIRT